MLKLCKFVQESSEKMLNFKAQQLVSIEVKRMLKLDARQLTQQISYLLRFMKNRFSTLIFIQSMSMLVFLFSQP